MTTRWSVLLVLTVLFAASGDARTRKRSTRNRTVEPKAATGILRAQILLDRAHFSPGEIDGRPGANFDHAIAGFQESHSLPPSGKLDDLTWEALNAGSVPLLVPYRITEADVAGPFIDIPKDLIEQSKLEKLGFSSGAEALGEQFHCSPSLLERLNPTAKLEAGEEIQVPNVLTGATAGKAAKVIVSKAGTVRALDASGKILAQYPSSSGSEHDPLPIGTWKIKGVSRNPAFNYNPELFWDAAPGHTKAKVPSGPNNPVGVVWIDLSKEHYGIHGTPEPGQVGHTQSHGCIRLTNWDAMRLAAMVSPGVPAVLTE